MVRERVLVLSASARDLDELELPYIARDRRLSDSVALILEARREILLRLNLVFSYKSDYLALSVVFHLNAVPFK